MKIQQSNSEMFEQRIKFYIEKPLAQLQSIIPKWAYGTDSDQMLDIALHPKSGEYIIFLVDTKYLIEKSEFNEVIPDILFTGEILNDGRGATILHRWENNKFIDPPTVEIFNGNNKLCFSDGRHRSKTTYLLGNKHMPIAIQQTEVGKISKIIELVPI